MLSAILNTWLPRSNFIYSNNTLLAEEGCKSKLRYLKHWYRLLCPGLVIPILGHSFGRSWYMRLFHTPRTSFLLTTRLWKQISCSGVIFIPGKNLRAPSTVSLNSSLRLYPIKTLCSCLLVVSDVRAYCVLSNHCHIQILDVSHDLLDGFVSGLPFSSPPVSYTHLTLPTIYSV